MPIIATTDTSELGCVSCGYPCKIKNLHRQKSAFSELSYSSSASPAAETSSHKISYAFSIISLFLKLLR